MKRALLVGLSLACLSGSADAQVRAAGYAHGADHCYAFQAPLGWDMDTHSMASEGVPAAFHPRGDAWRASWSFIYTRPVPKSAGDADPIRVQVDEMVGVYRRDGVPIAATRIGTLQATLGEVGQIWEFTGHPNGGRELGVYFEGPRTVNFFIAPITPNADADAIRDALHEIGKSYEARNDCVPCKASGACVE